MASQPIYQFYAELLGYKPKLWRRFQVAGNITMARLGYIIMTMYEMQANHLFCFDYPVEKYFRASMLEEFSEAEIDRVLDGTDFVNPKNKNWHFEILTEETADSREDMSEKLFDATRTILNRICFHETEIITFTYDYGDGWVVLLTLEKIFADKELPVSELPRVLEGAGYGIIEDCGGTGGLEKLAKEFKKKKGSVYKEYCDRLGREDLDLAAFDLNDMNFRLKKVPRIYSDIYEKGYEPTKRLMDIDAK